MAKRDLTFSVTGSEQVIRNVLALPKRIRRRAFRVALDAAGGEIKREVQKRAPVETGLLKRSMGVKTVVPDNERTAWTKVGPRRGFKAPLGRTKRGKLKAVSTKLQALLPTSANAIYRNPTRYAHLVEHGTKRGVRARRFMKLSAQLRYPAAVAKINSKLRSAVWNYNN